MPRALEATLLILVDYIALSSTFIIWAKLRALSGFFAIADLSILIVLSTTLFAFWIFLFVISGMYRSQRGASWLSQFITRVKVVSLGTIIIFLVTIEPAIDFSSPFQLSRVFIVVYWLLAITLISLFRYLILMLQRRLSALGIGRRRAVVVGSSPEAHTLGAYIQNHPLLGYELIGYVYSVETPRLEASPLLGPTEEIEHIIKKNRVCDLIVAVAKDAYHSIDTIVEYAQFKIKSIKVLPDLVEAFPRSFRTTPVYNLPLVEIRLGAMSEIEIIIKRFLDIVLSVVILLLTLPISVFMITLIKLFSKGPILKSYRYIGKNQHIFEAFKFDLSRFREGSHLNQILRRYKIDWLPIFLNLAKGDLSFIGPGLDQEKVARDRIEWLPDYSKRFQVRPGLIGWAQLKRDFGEPASDIEERMAYDFHYIENMSLILDVRILLYWVGIRSESLRGKE